MKAESVCWFMFPCVHGLMACTFCYLVVAQSSGSSGGNVFHVFKQFVDGDVEIPTERVDGF
jgi:hypothetical protein